MLLSLSLTHSLSLSSIDKEDRMEKSFVAGKKWHSHFWFVLITSFILLLLLCSHYSNFISGMNGLINLANFVVLTQNSNHLHFTTNSNNNQTFSRPLPNVVTTTTTTSEQEEGVVSDLNSCLGRYVYVHNLPRRFNHDLLENCHSLLTWSDMCPYVSNMGFGPRFADSEKMWLSSSNDDDSWFATNQFMLEVIFYNRMKQYECLTTNSSLASVVYVPFYAGLEVGRNLWGVNTTTRDYLPLDLVRWLADKPEWKVMYGRDHFLVSGRIAWDFRRASDNESDWGNKLMFLPESKNMTMLSIESTCWNNDIAIPYPTYFHPSSDDEVYDWQSRMRREERRYLFSFAGAPRPKMQDSIRSEIISQCQKASGRECKLLNCNSTQKNCKNPVNVLNMFRNSVFCLQPPGDSYTRRSIFDSILAGCIPVFFHVRSAYLQYVWHLPKNYTKYSVFIPDNDVKDGKVKIVDVLQRFSRDEVVSMREEVIRLIPSVIYANPKARLETVEDAFDIAVKGILERVEATRKDILEGRTSRLDFGEKSTWK